MRSDSKSILKRQQVVYNNKLLTPNGVVPYVGPAFGPSNLAPHIGLQCLVTQRTEPAYQPDPAPPAGCV